MQTQNYIKELTEGMQNLCAVANRIVACNGNADPIEIDLLMEDLRRLYGVALMLGGTTLPAHQAEPEPVEEPMPDQEMLSSTMMATMAAMSVATAATAVAEPAPEPEPVPEPEPEQPKTQQSSLLDYLKHPIEDRPTMRTLGESLLQPKSDTPLEKKVDDLRTVININDKFSFMSELFKNNMRAYNDFIMYLNGLTSREEALAYVAETADRYQWDNGSTAVQAFYKVFDKKF